MDKENYDETYEYLPASGSNTEAEPYQFFVVQDDGTFLINRQVQYVTQVTDDKEVLEGEQACTMLDVAPQQFFVDIDTTTEMISVPDQFNITEGTSNLYTSSYLLQPETATPADQIESNVEQLKTNLQVDSTLAEPNKQVNSLTEITLTDEQYHVLEQKGWILLETNEKIYVLDTLGLHDITNNEKLIEKLKSDDTAPSLETEPGQLKIQYPTTLAEMDIEQLNCAQNEIKLEETTDLSLMVDENKVQKIQNSQWEEKATAKTTDATNAPLLDSLYKEVCDDWKDENVLRIRTDFNLKDIPDKIVLGKTVNGKRLVCKIIKQDNDVVKETKNPEPEVDLDAISDTVLPSDLGDDKLDSIFKMCFTEKNVKYNTEDVAFAEKVINQLARLPAVKPSVTNRNILVTKVVVSHEDSNLIESLPTLVTGEVMSVDKAWRFVHKPDLYATAKSGNESSFIQVVRFYAEFGIPGVLGAIDCTRVAIVRPSEHEERYFCRKQYHSLNVQIICDADKYIMSVDASFGGATHDPFIWGDHPLNTHLKNISQRETIWFLELSQAQGTAEVDHNFLHIHIHEIRLQDIVRTSVTLNKRRLELSSGTRHSEKIFIPDLPLEPPTEMETENTMYGYACGTCAEIFRSEKDLSDHRESHKMDTDDKLTIDTREENYNKNGILVLADPFTKTKMYACIQCNSKFQRLNNCQRHVKTHMAPEPDETSNDKKRVYKCKICYSFFHHAPTLLKHIMKNHIKVDK